MSIEPLPRVLCVDDEAALLTSLKRTLAGKFQVDTATGGAAALLLLEPGVEFAVVISDMRMPKMDGAKLLGEFARRAPDTTRVLLTGYADVEAVVRAVNEGKIFGYLSKPMDGAALRVLLEQSVARHRSVVAEHELLEHTLGGAVSVLTDVLALTTPSLFTRTSAVRRIANFLGSLLGVPNQWKLDMAAMLSRLGCVAVPTETLERHFNGQPLTDADAHLLEGHPDVAWRLLSKIPRLEDVAEIIRRQHPVPDGGASPEVLQAAAILRLALEFDRRLLSGESVGKVRLDLSSEPTAHPPELLKLLRDYQPEIEEVTRSVKLSELQPGMVLIEEVRSCDGKVLVAKGFEVNAALLERLKRFAEGTGVAQPLWVRLRLIGAS